VEPESPGETEPGETEPGETDPGEGPDAELGLRPDAPFLVAGDRAVVRGRPSTGIDEIRIHPHAVARAFHLKLCGDRGFQADRPTARRVEVAPGATRRDLVTDGDSIIESVLVLQRLPGVVVQWEHPAAADGSDRSPEPAARPVELEVSWLLSPGARAQLPDGAAGPLLVIPAGVGRGPGSRVEVESGSDVGSGDEPRRIDGGAARVEILGAKASWKIDAPGSSPPSATPRVPSPLAEPAPLSDAKHTTRPDDGRAPEVGSRIRRITLRASIEIGRPLTLLFARDSGDRIQRAAILRRVDSLDSELSARARADARAAEAELSLSTDDPREDDAFRWTRRRLHGVVGHDEGGGTILLHPDGGAWTLRDMAAIGTDLLALGRHQQAREIVDRAGDLLAGGPPGASPSSNAPGEPEEPGDPVGLRASDDPAALLLLVARYTLWTADAGPLRRLDRRVDRWLTGPGTAPDGTHPDKSRPEGARPQGPRPDEPPPEGTGPPGADPIPGVLLRAGTEWAEALEATGERERADGIRSLLDSSRSPDEEAAEPAPPTHPLGALSPAQILLELLGARADAFVGRLRLAPRIPRDRNRWTVDGILMGDSRMCLSYHTVDHRHTFRLEPTKGRVPMNLVFEPLLPPGPAPGRTWVDGESADVDRYRKGNRLGIRLQLPLDAPREVVVDEDTEGRRRR